MKDKAYLGWTEIAPGGGSEAARRVMKQMFFRITGSPLPPVVKTESGKPELLGSPWHCSITHTEKMAFCLLAKQTVGLDGEALSRRVRPTLPPRVLAPGERTRFLEAGGQDEDFLTYWVLKEAYVKYTGQGLRGGIWRDLDFTLMGDHARLAGSNLHFSILHLADHVLALCGASEMELVLEGAFFDDSRQISQN